MTIQAVQHIRRMRGGAQSHLMRCSDGNFYVVKFQNNPQHTRVLANDWLGTCFAALVGLSVPTAAIVEVHPWLIEHTPELRFELGGRKVIPLAGLCFGSRYVVPHDEGVVHDYLPEGSMGCVRNQDEFAGILCLDKWTCNADGRQVAFWKRLWQRKFTASFIDQGYCFNAGEWSFPDAPLRGVFGRNDVYANVTGWESFEPWISRIENFSESLLWPIAQHIALMRFSPTTVNSQYIAYSLAADASQKRFRALTDQGAKAGMSLITVGKLLVIRPNIEEQGAIAKALSDMDALLEQLESLIAKKRDLKQAAMKQLLTGKIRLPGFTGEWEQRRLGDLTNCVAGGTPSTQISSYWGGRIRWMNSGELNLKRVYEVEGRITNAGLSNSSTHMLPIRCVLIGLAGQGKTRGTVAMNFVELCTNQSIAAILPNAAFAPEYLYYNLDARYDELRELSSGGGGRGGLNLTLINNLIVPLPPVAEQEAIGVVLTDMDAEIVALEQRLAKTRELKQAMMQELLTGRTRLVGRKAAHAKDVAYA